METQNTCIVIVGHVDHGKSTFIGRLLYDTKNLSEDRLNELKQTSAALGRLEFAYVMDQFKEEREANITIDTSQTFLTIDQRPFLIIDAPGHREYLKNMITGATQAQHAILMLDANEGIRQQTDTHARIVKILGIHRLAVLLNKMDKLNFDEKIYVDFKKELENRFHNYDLNIDAFIPVSAYNGDNVVTRSTQTPWYQGPTAFEFIKSCTPDSVHSSFDGFRFPVQLIHEINGRRMALGRVEIGKVAKGDVFFFPSGETGKIDGIEKFPQNLEEAPEGECVALSLKTPKQLQRGEIICGGIQTVKPAREFTVDTFWSDSSPLKQGDNIHVECQTQVVSCKVQEISDPFEAKVIPELKEGEIARVRLRPQNHLLVYEGDNPFSKIVFHEGKSLMGCGVVQKVDL